MHRPSSLILVLFPSGWVDLVEGDRDITSGGFPFTALYSNEGRGRQKGRSKHNEIQEGGGGGGDRGGPAVVVCPVGRGGGHGYPGLVSVSADMDSSASGQEVFDDMWETC